MKEQLFEQLSKMSSEEIQECLHSLKWKTNDGEQMDDEEIEDAEGYLRNLGYISFEESQQKINELQSDNNTNS